MSIKLIIIITFFTAVAGFLSLTNANNRMAKQGAVTMTLYKEKIKLAVCPTYHELARGLDAAAYQIYFTNSTAESMILAESGALDMVLSGRVLKLGEPPLDQVVVNHEGYSFLSDQELVVYEDDLPKYKIFTDLDVVKIRTAFSLEDVHGVNDVYEHIKFGIVITSWENTDYNKGQVVHLLQNNNQRVNLSRRPVLYCLDSCDNEMVANTVLVLQN